MLFVFLIGAARDLLELQPTDETIRHAITLVFDSARQWGMSTFELASSQQSLSLLKPSKRFKKEDPKKAQYEVEVGHLLLCLVVVIYKLDLLERTDKSEFDVEVLPRTKEEQEALKWEAFRLLHKAIKLHRALLDVDSKELRDLFAKTGHHLPSEEDQSKNSEAPQGTPRSSKMPQAPSVNQPG
jgi:AMMECR1 domain-containing protein